MNDNLFRKKSLDKIKSPENLDDYIQVSNPGIWLLLVSIIALLLGACIWGIFGHIDSTVDVNVRAENDSVICYITEDNIFSVQEGMTVRFGDYETVITEIGQKVNSEYVCILRNDQTVPDGIYKGKLVIQSYKPISFILN